MCNRKIDIYLQTVYIHCFILLSRMPIRKTVFISSLQQSIEYVIGQSAADNMVAIMNAEPHHLWFHVDGVPSCHVIAIVSEDLGRNELQYVVRQGAALCKQHTKRVCNMKRVPITYTAVKNVEPTNIVGTVRVHLPKIRIV